MSITEKAYKKTDDQVPKESPTKRAEELPEEELKEVAGGTAVRMPIPSDGYATCC
jgi:hypothetical protein